MHQNICGLMYNFTSLQALAYKEGSIDVLGLSETYIVNEDESDHAGLFKIYTYTLIKRNKSHGKKQELQCILKILFFTI